MQQPMPDHSPSRANTHSSVECKRAPRRSIHLLGAAILASLTMSWAHAQYPGADAAAVNGAMHEEQPTTTPAPAGEILLPPLVIESIATNPDPTQDELMQKFRDALAQPPIWAAAEHRFPNGSLDITTRFGHFCAEPPPAHLESGLGGDVTLVAPCVLF